MTIKNSSSSLKFGTIKGPPCPDVSSSHPNSTSALCGVISYCSLFPHLTTRNSVRFITISRLFLEYFPLIHKFSLNSGSAEICPSVTMYEIVFSFSGSKNPAFIVNFALPFWCASLFVIRCSLATNLIFFLIFSPFSVM